MSLLVPAFICGFCMQNSDFWIRITSLCGSQTTPVVLCMQNSVISTRKLVFMGARPHLSFCACKTTLLASELVVSMGPSPHLWFLHAKQRLLDKNYKSLWVPALICGFCMQKSDFWVKITSPYGSLTMPVDL